MKPDNSVSIMHVKTLQDIYAMAKTIVIVTEE